MIDKNEKIFCVIPILCFFVIVADSFLWLQHVLTGEPALLQLAAQQMKRIASDSQRSTQERFYVKGLRAVVEGPDGPQELSYVQSVLMPIKRWADKQLQDYHLHFADVRAPDRTSELRLFRVVFMRTTETWCVLVELFKLSF